MSCNPAYWDELGPEDTSSSSSKSRDFYSRGGVPPSSTNKAYGQSFAPQSYMDHSLVQHGHNRQNTTRIDRRHSHAIAFSQGSDRDYYDDGDTDDSVAMKRRQAPKRPRRRRSEYDEDGHFSNDSYSPKHSEVDEDSDWDYNSEDDQERVQGQRRHTTGARHGRSSRSQELTADGLNATYDPHRSNPIAIAPPPRRESYLEEQALSARGDRLGGYFPLHEDPSLRIQRSHPFHSASAKARKQSITLAQSAAAQHSAAHRSHHPSISSRLDHGSSLSASISHRRGNSYASTPKQHLEYSSSSARCPDPLVAPGHSNTNSAIAWRTIHGFNTSSKPTREPGISSMTSVGGLDTLAGQYTQLSNSNYEDVDPLDGPRPRTQPPILNRRPPQSLSPSQEAAEQVDRPDISPPPCTAPMGKYYPSIYEKSQESRRQAAQSMGMNPDEALYYSSDEYTDGQALPIGNPVDSAIHASQHHRTASKGHQRAKSTSTYYTQNYHTPSRSLGPESPRLNPLGSPGPVTPMDLEAHSFAAAGGGSANSYFDRSCSGAVNPKSPRDPRARG